MRAATALLLLTLATAALVAAGCGSDGAVLDDEPAAAEGSNGRTVTVELEAQNDSGESGTAALTGMGAQTRVVLTLENPASDSPQPAHIHKGTCAELDPAPAYPLANVEDGASETTVDAPLDELESGRFAVNVHMSEAEAEIYVACGNIGGEDGGSDDDSGSEPGYGY